MADFAELAGLSRPTISKYFSEPASVRKATRDKIERALQKYDYRPNLFAVNLNRKSAKIIGVIVPDTADPFYANLLRYVELDCEANGYLAVVLSSRGDATLEARAVDTLLSLKAAGAIVAPLGQASDHEMLQSLRARIPIVFLDSKLDEDTPFVGTDNFQSVALITEYLCRTGERPTFFEMPPANQNSLERRAAYRATMERLGHDPIVITAGPERNWRFEQIAHAEAGRLWRDGGFPTRTILCANDRLAMGLMAATFAAGHRVGRDGDVRVAGHDDLPASRYLCPPLTTVAQDLDMLGSRAVDLLLARLDGVEPTGPVRLEAELKMRSSA